MDELQSQLLKYFFEKGEVNYMKFQSEYYTEFPNCTYEEITRAWRTLLGNKLIKNNLERNNASAIITEDGKKAWSKIAEKEAHKLSEIREEHNFRKEIDDLRKQNLKLQNSLTALHLEDYPETKKLAAKANAISRWSLIVAIISALVAAIALIK